MSNWYWTNSPSYRLYRNTYFTSVWDTVDFHATKIYFTFLAKLQWICSWLYYLHCVNLYFFCLLSLFKMSSIHYLSKIIFFICLILDLSTLKEYSKDWEGGFLDFQVSPLTPVVNLVDLFCIFSSSTLFSLTGNG